VLHLAVGGRRQALRGGRLRLRIRCSAACTARAWSAEAVKARTRRLDAGKPAEFVLRLYRRARRAVAGGGHTTVEVRVTARAAGFPPRRVVVPVLLS
jgi:hypothetical protein